MWNRTKRAKRAREVRERGPWFHQIDLGDGIRTRDIAPTDGPQPHDHPRQRWDAVRDAIPDDLTGLRILDVGCADGFFSLEFARRGADVVGIDASPQRVERLRWAARQLGLRNVRAEVGDVYDLEPFGSADWVVLFALLYHLRDPLSAVEEARRRAPCVWIESSCVRDDASATLHLEAPSDSHPARAKWFPTTRAVEEMLRIAGYDAVERVGSVVEGDERCRVHFRGVATDDRGDGD